MYRLGPDEPTASTGGCHTDLADKLVPFMGLAFADAFHRRFMNTVNLVLVFAFLLKNPSPDFHQRLQFLVRMAWILKHHRYASNGTEKLLI